MVRKTAQSVHTSERLLNHAKKPLARITLADLQSFAQELASSGLAPISRVRTLAAVKSLFAFAHRMRHIPANPAAELTLPSYENRLTERILVERDVQRMLAAETAPRDKTLLRLLYVAGLRVSEVCRLRWRNLHPRGDAGQLTVFGKNGRTRAITLPAEVWADLVRRRGATEELVFPSRSGRPLDRGRVRVILRRAAQRAGVTEAVSPHWLRHAHASHALDHGAPIHLVQATLGHSSVATASRYLHARPGDSSARFVAPAIGLQSRRINLLDPRTGVMNLLTGLTPAKGEQMSTKTIETKETAAASEEPPKMAKVRAQKPRVASAKGKVGNKATSAKKRAKAPKAAKSGKTAQGGSKTAKVLELLRRPDGATLQELMKATGWLAHSVRGFLSGTVGKKMGMSVTSAKGEDGTRSYSIKG